MKHDPEVKIFNSDKYRYFRKKLPHLVSLFISLVKTVILLWYITWLPTIGGTILKNTLWENRFH